jgi:hypothetical protein
LVDASKHEAATLDPVFNAPDNRRPEHIPQIRHRIEYRSHYVPTLVGRRSKVLALNLIEMRERNCELLIVTA